MACTAVDHNESTAPSRAGEPKDWCDACRQEVNNLTNVEDTAASVSEGVKEQDFAAVHDWLMTVAAWAIYWAHTLALVPIGNEIFSRNRRGAGAANQCGVRPHGGNPKRDRP